MKLDQLIREIRERDALRSEWQHNAHDRARIEARLDELTHNIAARAGLGSLLDAPTMFAGLGLGARRRRRRI
jgi:hypothetical protein